MSSTVTIKNAKGETVLTEKLGRPIRIPGIVGCPQNWPWPEMPKAFDRKNRDMLAGFTAVVTEDPAPPPKPARPVKTDRELVEMHLGIPVERLLAVLDEAAGKT